MLVLYFYSFLSPAGLTESIDATTVIPISYRWGLLMTAVTVSPKYQVVIPKEVRESLGVFSGQKLQVLTYQGRIELIPIKPMKKMRGFLKGLNTTIKRDKDRL